jgi:hypothetical protein
MRSVRAVAGYGFLVWFLTLAASMLLFPFKQSWPVLFDSAMPVALAIVTVALAHCYLRGCGSRFARDSGSAAPGSQ